MSRAILLPTTGDPFICSAWIASYKKFQQQYIDKLYVCINSPLEDVVYNYLVEIFEEIDASIISHRKFLDHGPAITKLVEICQEDYIFLSEDDFYVQQQGIIHEWFKMVETGLVDVVGSSRGCVGNEIIDAAARKFKLSGKEARQPSLWPALLVVSTDNLKRTDMNFAGKRFNAGEYVPELDFTPTQTTGGDTFVWASIQLRALGFKIHTIPHHRWIDVLRERNIPPAWIHVGSSSSSLNGHLLDENMIPICDPDISYTAPRNFPSVPDRGIQEHFEAKFAGWAVFNELFPIPIDRQAAFFNKKYRDAVNRSINGCGLFVNNVNLNKSLMKRIIAPTIS